MMPYRGLLEGEQKFRLLVLYSRGRTLTKRPLWFSLHRPAPSMNVWISNQALPHLRGGIGYAWAREGPPGVTLRVREPSLFDLSTLLRLAVR